jgi:hypothetical protein
MILFCAARVSPSLAADSAKPDGDGWITLFNAKNFDRWYTYLEADGNNNDPQGVFKVDNGTAHIGDPAENNGYLATTREFFQRLHSRRVQMGHPSPFRRQRNSGLLYLPAGADRIYPTSIECQIEETGVGDMWLVSGTAATAFVIAPTVPIFDDDMNTGTSVRSNLGHSIRILKSGDFENRDDWTTGEIAIDGNQSTQIMNGRIVNHVNDILQPDPSNPAHMIPLRSGRILLGAEDGAEIFFRNIKVKPLATTQ